MTDIVTVQGEPETIEFGGLIWRRDNHRAAEGVQYRAFKGDIEFRVYQYPDDLNWLWSANFFHIIPDDIRSAGLERQASAIVSTREAAMDCCITGFDRWLNSMQRVLLLFRPDDQYSKGFLAGQQDIKAKVAEVLK